MAVIALRDSVLSSFSAAEAPSPPTPERQITQPVILVPMTAPIMTAIACRSRIMPELTKPTTITLVALELWITAVTPVPSKMPLSGVLESRYRISSSLLPATRFSPSPISDIPNRNIATPPRSTITFEISILPPPAGFHRVP